MVSQKEFYQSFKLDNLIYSINHLKALAVRKKFKNSFQKAIITQLRFLLLSSSVQFSSFAFIPISLSTRRKRQNSVKDHMVLCGELLFFFCIKPQHSLSSDYAGAICIEYDFSMICCYLILLFRHIQTEYGLIFTRYICVLIAGICF